MPKLSIEAWQELRARREALGESFGSLAQAFGINKAAIVRRAKKENWSTGSDMGGELRRRVTGIVTTSDPKKREQALDEAAITAAEIVSRHRRDWEKHHELFPVEACASDFEHAKRARITAEVLSLRQKGELSVWGLHDQGQEEVEIVIERSYGL